MTTLSSLKKSLGPLGTTTFRGYLAEDYDGIGQYVLVTLSRGSTSGALKARVAAGDFNSGAIFPRGTPVVVFVDHGQLEILSLGSTQRTQIITENTSPDFYAPPVPPSIVQSKFGYTTATFDNTPAVGHAMLAIPFTSGHTDIWSTDPRQGGTCPQDANMTKFGVGHSNFDGSSGLNGLAILGKIFADTYAGSYGSKSGCDSSQTYLGIFEIAGFDSVSDYSVATILGGSAEANDTSLVNCGTFSNVGPNDLCFMGFASKRDGYGCDDPGVGVNGFTQLLDTCALVNGWTWLGWKIGNGDASVTLSNGDAIIGPSGIYGAYGAVAVLLRQ